MALDGIILHKVKEDLESHLPIKINRISETSKTEVVFNVHADTIRQNMIISLHSNYNHICLSKKNITTYNDPSTFVMVLRKHILNGIIYKIEQFDFDRYLLLHIKARDEIYDEKKYILSVELMGKYANLILIDDNNKIIDALKKIPPYENTRRTILPGANFTLPDKQNKQNIYKLNNINLDESLVDQIQGVSKQLESEIRYRLQKQSLDEIIKEIKLSKNLYLTKKDNKYEYHIIPLTYLNSEYEKWDIQDGLDEIYFKEDEKERIKNISNDLFKIVKRQIKHYSSKIQKLNISLQEATNFEEDKNYGDILFSYNNLELKGLENIEIEDYDGKLNKIKLDPKLSIKANANKYYQRYQKKKKGISYIDEQLLIANNELTYFESLYEQLLIANYVDALDIKDELSKYGYLKKQTSKNKKNKKITLYQIKIDSYTITFGKNNLQNNYLTFDYAKPKNTWFHAKQYHGSHVIVDSDSPNEKIIRICANIAVYNSNGRMSSSVPVDYCLVKDVKKIKGTKPGFVSFKNYKTIFIDPFEDKELTIYAI